MLIVYSRSTRQVKSISGFQGPVTREMVDSIRLADPSPDDAEYRVYDAATMAAVWACVDAGASISLAFDAQGRPTGVIPHGPIQVAASKAQALADDADTVAVTAIIPEVGRTVELWVDGAKVAEAATDAEGRATFEVTFAAPGLYHVEVRDTTPPPSPYFQSRYGRAAVQVEAIAP